MTYPTWQGSQRPSCVESSVLQPALDFSKRRSRISWRTQLCRHNSSRASPSRMPLCSSRRQPPLLPCRWRTPLGWPRPRRIGTPPGRMPPHTTSRFTQRGRSVPPAKKDQSLADSGKHFLPMRQGHIRRMSLLTSSPGSIGPVWATHASLRQVVGSSKPIQPSQSPLCLSRVSDPTLSYTDTSAVH